jgi:adenosylhomocysteine nucleosidase
MSRIAIVAALEREVRPLIRSWRVSEKEHEGRRFRFFEGDHAIVVCGGIGTESARRAAEAVIVLYAPGIVYSAGYAGALDPALKVGDVFRPLRVIRAEDGSSVSLAEGQGVLVSYGQVASPEQKSKLRESFSALAVDMEASAVAHAAEVHGAEFAVIKVISDELDFDFPATDQFVDATGHFHEFRFALFAAIRPWLWPRVLRLARNSNRATRALCEQLRTLANSPSSVAK